MQVSFIDIVTILNEGGVLSSVGWGHLAVSGDIFVVTIRDGRQGRKVTIVFGGQAGVSIRNGIGFHRKEFSRRVTKTKKSCLAALTCYPQVTGREEVGSGLTGTGLGFRNLK